VNLLEPSPVPHRVPVARPGFGPRNRVAKPYTTPVGNPFPPNSRQPQRSLCDRGHEFAPTTGSPSVAVGYAYRPATRWSQPPRTARRSPSRRAGQLGSIQAVPYDSMVAASNHSPAALNSLPLTNRLVSCRLHLPRRCRRLAPGNGHGLSRFLLELIIARSRGSCRLAAHRGPTIGGDHSTDTELAPLNLRSSKVPMSSAAMHRRCPRQATTVPRRPNPKTPPQRAPCPVMTAQARLIRPGPGGRKRRVPGPANTCRHRPALAQALPSGRSGNDQLGAIFAPLTSAPSGTRRKECPRSSGPPRPAP